MGGEKPQKKTNPFETYFAGIKAVRGKGSTRRCMGKKRGNSEQSGKVKPVKRGKNNNQGKGSKKLIQKRERIWKIFRTGSQGGGTGSKKKLHSTKGLV